MSYTTSDIIKAVREISFDRFPIPIFTLKAKANHTVNMTTTHFKVLNGTTEVLSLAYATYPTMDALALKLIEENYPLAYSGYFKGDHTPSELVRFTGGPLGANLRILVKNYYNDDDVKAVMVRYLKEVLLYDEDTTTVADLDTLIPTFTDKVVTHMVLWCAIMEVDDRRINDYASAVLQGYFSDGSGSVMVGGLAGNNVWNNGDSINVSIGSVFSISDNDGDSGSQYQGGGGNSTLPGFDNVLEDWSSFWWKLFLVLRDRIEQRFHDYGFRKDLGVWGEITLDKSLNFRTYYDSYPFSLSPIARDIIN